MQGQIAGIRYTAEYFDITVLNPDRVDGCFGGENFVSALPPKKPGLDASKTRALHTVLLGELSNAIQLK